MTKSTVTVVALALTILAVTAAAFSPMHHHRHHNNVAFQRASRLQPQQPPLFMFSADDSSEQQGTVQKAVENNKLEVKALEMDSNNKEEEETSKNKQKQVRTFKNLSTGEIQELKIDVGAEASVSPFKMAWWAYGLVVYPFVLLADDVFHFLPKSS